MATHFEESLQRDIDRIRAKISAMSGMAERALRDCMVALRERNRPLAYAVILRDKQIDELEKEVDRLCLEFLVRQQPVAGPLRLAYSTIRINLELERVGDYAESIARQSLKLMPLQFPIPIDRFQEMANLSIPMLHDAVQAFVKQDPELARRTVEIEEAVDVLKSKLNADMIGLFRENKLPFEALNPLMMITRRLERVSDQARNICMEVLYMCTGEYQRHQGAEAFRLLFVDEQNSSLSQMAETIANSFGFREFIFASAGLSPKPVDAGTREFLQSKHLDTTHLATKSVDQIPNLDHYHVVVGLTKQAKQAFPTKPRKAVYLEWIITDPSTVSGTPAQKKAAYEEAYQFLQEHIKDLAEAVLGGEDA